MDEQESLNRAKWECKYHVVFIPKCRRKILYQELRRYLDPALPWRGEKFRLTRNYSPRLAEEGSFLLALLRTVRARGGGHRIFLLPWVDPTGPEWHHTNLKFGATRSVLHEKPQSGSAAYAYPCTGDRHGAGFSEFPR